MAEIIVRNAMKSDCQSIVTMIKELATFHRNPNKVIIDEKVLLTDGFGEKPCFFCLIAEVKESETVNPAGLVNGTVNPVGFVLYYNTYSTWVGKTVYVEDIYVRETYREKGVGTRLLKQVTHNALEQGAKRIGWSALDWNTKAIEFYKKLGAEMSDEWRMFTFGKDAMESLVHSS